MFNLKYMSIAAAAFLASSVAHADDLVFKFHNKSDFVVTELYASPSNVSGWEEDILGADVLGSGETVNVTIADGRRACEYDLRIVFDDGDAVEDRTDLCDTASYTVNN